MKITWIEKDKIAASSIPVSEEDIRSIWEHGIRAIVSATEQPITKFSGISDILFKELKIDYYHVPIQDTYPPTLEQSFSILDFIDEKISNNQAVLIHCHAGIGRTGTILHLYYINKGISIRRAGQIIQKKRSQNILLTVKQKQFLEEFYNYNN